MDRKRIITLKDIASVCGFSANTVSRALRNDPRLSDRTKELIHAAASEMGYIKNVSASVLSSGRSNTIAVIINDVQNPHFSNMLGIIEQEARKNGYDVMILCTHMDPTLGMKMVKTAISRSVDGILYFPFYSDYETVELLEKTQIPYVLMDRWIKNVTADTVRLDDEQGGYLAGEHLIELGHRRFLYLCGMDINSSQIDRKAGLFRAIRTHGIPLSSVRIIPLETFEEANENDALDMLLKPMDYTAIVSFNDDMAYYVLNHFAKQGVHVPEDVSLVGFDHLCSFIPYLPKLSSIAAGGETVGVRSVRCLLNQMQNARTEKQVVILPVQFYDEGTTAPVSNACEARTH